MRGIGYIKSKEEIVLAINQSINMTDASRILGVPFTTFADWAKKYGLYKPNPKLRKRLVDFKSHGLRNHIIKNGLKEEKCEECGLENVWNGKPIILQVHHADGNRKNNNINNLKILCPNCHSQTKTFSGANVRNKHAPVG